MSAVRVPGGTRAPGLLVAHIIMGRPWTARHIHNNNLRQHCRVLGRIFQKKESWFREFWFGRSFGQEFIKLTQAVAERSCLLTAWHPHEMQVIPALLRLTHYSMYWLRKPEDWTPPGECTGPRQQWEHLLQFLLCRWPLPRWFASAWETFGDAFHVERDWYVHAAGGSSLRGADGMPATVTNRALHFMMEAPDHLTVRQAMRWGQATAAECSSELREAVIASSMVNDLSHDFIWSRLLQKAVAARATADAWELLADGIALIIRRDGWRRAKRLIDEPWPKLLDHCRSQFYSIFETYRRDLGYRLERLNTPGFRKELSNISLTTWTALLPEQMCNVHPDQWGNPRRFEEITSLGNLIAEGMHMRHCVVTYRRRCQSGRSAIFSLRFHSVRNPTGPGRRALTIEVERESRTIVQVKGRWNRHPYEFENAVLRRWARANRLRMP